MSIIFAGINENKRNSKLHCAKIHKNYFQR